MSASMIILLLCICVSSAMGDAEPTDCSLSREEKLWDSMLRMQNRVEIMLNEIRKTEEHVLAVLEYRKQEMDDKLASSRKAMEDGIELVQTDINTLKDVGSSYVRWGRTSCPADNHLVYTGFTAGSHYTKPGGAANWLCLTDQPQWAYYEDKVESGAKVYGAEYEFSDYHGASETKFFGKSLNDQDSACAVCKTSRSDVLMIPGRLECYPGWNKEYSGYIVAGAEVHASVTEFICLDSDAEMLTGGSVNTNGRVVYIAEAICGTLKCPPYVNGRELTCVVCSK